MSQRKSEFADPPVAEGEEMIAEMRRGVVSALSDHREHGRSVVVWDRQSDQILEIPAHQILIPEGESTRAQTSPDDRLR
jgi:hypothetical protein